MGVGQLTKPKHTTTRSNLAVVVASHNELEAFDAENGERLDWFWSPREAELGPSDTGDKAPNHLCESEAFSNVAIGGDGTCYVGHTSGQLFALQDKNGDGKIDESLGEVS